MKNALQAPNLMVVVAALTKALQEAQTRIEALEARARMSTIHRTLVLNPVEPAPISMKLRTGLENTVEVEYLRQNGAPYNTDFGAQMYLIERTTGSVKAYILPAIDVINGRAQAYIPAGDISDRNGYNVQIIGTVEGEPRLIARGSAWSTRPRLSASSRWT